jgi:hypothetical protein
MYLALFSVAFGSVLTFGQAAALFNILDLEKYVDYRAVLNTMNIAAPFLCLGFDSAAPVLRRMNPGFPFFWNLLVLHLVALLLFVTSALILPTASKLLPLILGLAASTSVAAALIVANHYRVEGEIRRYFISVNIADKLVRSIIILALAVLVKDILLWAIMLSVLCFAYVGLISLQTGCRPRLDYQVFFSHVRISVPYIFAALGIIAMTRMPFYAAYLVDDKLFTAKIDIWLLFSLFLLIPVLNKSKVEESKSAGMAQEYVAAMKKSWGGLRNQELLVCSCIIALASATVLTGQTVQSDLLGIVLPLMVGMILISSQPNYVQVLCLFGKFGLGIKISFLITFASLMAYLPRFAAVEFTVPFLFVMSASIYCAIGCLVARLLEVKIADFWRWREALLLIFFSTLAMKVIDMLFNGGLL